MPKLSKNPISKMCDRPLQARLTKQARAAFERMCRDKGTRIGEEMRDAIMEHMRRAKPAYWPVRE